MPLKIWTNDVDYVIAESADEAVEIASDLTGAPIGDYADDEWTAWPDDKPFTFRYDEGDEYPGSPERRETRTGAEWVALRGRGYFACSEY
jgi:hypothetical protein